MKAKTKLVPMKPVRVWAVVMKNGDLSTIWRTKREAASRRVRSFDLGQTVRRVTIVEDIRT